MAVRVAICAAARVIRQLLTEGLLLSALGSVCGLLVARWLAAALTPALWGSASAVDLDLSIDGRAIAFTAAIATICTVLSALLPALRASDVHLAGACRSRADDDDRPAPRCVGEWLVAIQVALSVLLLRAAALLVRSVWNLNEVQAGFDPTNLLIFRLDPVRNGYSPVQARRSTPGRSNSSRRCPASDRHAAQYPAHRRRARVGRAPRRTDTRAGTPAAREFFLTHEAHMLTVGDDFFSTLSIPIRRGRTLSSSDVTEAQPVAIVNEALARQPLAARTRSDGRSRPTSAQGNDLRGGRRLRGYEVHVAAPAVAADRLLHLSPARRQHANVCREDNRRPARRGLGRARDVPTARSQPAASLPCGRRKHRSHRRCGGSG